MNLDATCAQIDQLLASILQHSGFRLTYTIRVNEVDETLNTVFDGPDVPLLLARRAELLLALEHMAVVTARLTSDVHDRISFDAGGFKAERDQRIQIAARRAIEQVETAGIAYHFPPMNSRERRLLHLALAPSGLVSASEGEEPHRHLVLHPSPASLSR